MKLKLKVAALSVLCGVIASCGVILSVSFAAKKTSCLIIISSDVESMAECEVTKGNAILLKCSGNQGVCVTTKTILGKTYTLTCDGVKEDL